MNENKKELISKNTSVAPLSTGLASRGLQVARQLAQRSNLEFTNSIGMKLVLIPKGTFMMGSPENEEGRCSDETQHEVTISKNYYLCATQVTQEQYEMVMGNNPSFFQGDELKGGSANRPVEQVSWNDAVEFCRKLSDLPEEKAAGRLYRLPTEAEWEYACRAGSETINRFGENSQLLGDYAWFIGNSNGETHPVGERKANAWGLYDMLGNVWEWCNDWYGEYPKGAVSDPVGPKRGSNRVFRGGSWFFYAEPCMRMYIDGLDTSIRNFDLGFRVALSSSGIPESPEEDK